MSYFLTNIHVNKIFHLENFDIPLDNDNLKHLIITGKNGSGKTILVNAIVEFLDMIKNDVLLNFLNFRQYKKNSIHVLENLKENDLGDTQIPQIEQNIKHWESLISDTFGKVELNFNDITKIIKSYNENNFVFAFYEAARKTEIKESKNPTKPNFAANLAIKKDNKVSQFLNFLVDLKVQEALARNERMLKDADEIRVWFESFEQLLKDIFQNQSIKLEFDYKDYSFYILDGVKKFKFTQLSDGYSAIIDIVADLILKMQEKSSPNREYLKHGIVIIDEIETHLHLELQRLILPMLTRIFPNIQFIVTTHSPFILNSLTNAVAYDLEKREKLEDLTEYSYEALSEGYFGVRSESSYVEIRFNKFKELANKGSLSDGEKAELNDLIKEFDDLSEVVSPQIKTEYYDVKLTAKNRVDL
ncbi:MAG: ATP-binding protein [Paludibacter sp.]|jgi:AAA15 family ATPase/GTPase|nr:ATP-binding protein [Paludibacter sp.]